MTTLDKEIPRETLEVLLKHKKDVLDNISERYQAEMTDANTDSERLFKYGFIFVSLVETIVGALAMVVSEKEDVFIFVISVMFLTVSISSVLYERVRAEKGDLRQRINSERDPIIQQIIMLKGFLEPDM